METKLTRRDFTSLLSLAGLSFAVPSLGAAAKPLPFKLGIITDELTEDLNQALDFINHYSLPNCELRDIWKKNIMNLSQDELDRAKRLIRQHNLKVSDIASPIFKYNLPEMPAKPSEKRDMFLASFTEQDTDDLLQHSFKLARFFGTNKVRIFSYWRVEDPQKVYPHVRKRLARAAKIAADNRITLVLENEPACNVGTGKELGQILRDINSPSLRGNWDPGNVVEIDEVPYPDGYEHVKGLFVHMHVKDAKKNAQTGDTKWLPVGAGTVDYLGQFKALRHDGYNGTVSLETHYLRPDGNKIESTRESLEGLLKVLGKV